jgi:hypothetical protein
VGFREDLDTQLPHDELHFRAKHLLEQSLGTVKFFGYANTLSVIYGDLVGISG